MALYDDDSPNAFDFGYTPGDYQTAQATALRRRMPPASMPTHAVETPPPSAPSGAPRAAATAQSPGVEDYMRQIADLQATPVDTGRYAELARTTADQANRDFAIGTALQALGGQ